MLGLRKPRRAVFNEITRHAVQDAIANPRDIDEDLFNAQQARRVLDRLVGYKISPLLWRRVQSGTSAGRVQSVALRIICDREAEIRAFVPEEYWTIAATLSKTKERETFTAMLIGRQGSQEVAESDAEADGAEQQRQSPNDQNGQNGQTGRAGRIRIELRGAGAGDSARAGRRIVPGAEVAPARRAPPAIPALHHQHAPAGRLGAAALQAEEDDEHRPGSL